MTDDRRPANTSRKPDPATPDLADPKLANPEPVSPAKDVSADAEAERERLEPGLNAEGTGGAGAPLGQRKGHENSNT